MKTVDLRRSRKFVMACAAVAAFAWSVVQPASAEVANPNLIPEDSTYIVSIPNGPEFWSAWETNGIYEGFKKFMALPDMEEKLANFRKELGIIESSLGFKIDGKTLSQVFSSADFYLQGSPTSKDKEFASVIIFKVSDDDKLTKLIDLAEKAISQAASDEETSDSEKASSPIKESEYKGVKIKTYVVDTEDEADDSDAKKDKSKAEKDDNNFVYARADGFLLLANNGKPIHQVVDRIKETVTTGTFASSEDYKKIEEALKAEKGQAYIYGDQVKAMDMQNNDESMGREVQEALRKMMQSISPVSKYGASIAFQPKEISSYSYSLLSNPTSDSIVMKYPGNVPLSVATLIPEETLFASATSLISGQGIYDFGLIMGDIIKKETDSKDKKSVERKLKDAEILLGFSVKNDFVPALGNEFALAFNKVHLDTLIPMVDATIIFGVQDKAKMTKVIDNLTRLVESGLAAKNEDDSTSAPKFVSETVDGQTIKTIEVNAMAGLTPGYVMTDKYLIIGSTKNALKDALAASAGKNLLTSASFKGLGHSISENANVIQYINLGKIVDIGSQVAKKFANQLNVSKYVEILQTLDATGSSNRVENGAMISHAVLKLK